MASIKIHVLHCGNVRVDRSLPFKEKTFHPAPYTGFFRSEKFQILLPVFAFLIEHPKGLVLVDTGWHTDVRLSGKKHLGGMHWRISKGELPEGQAVHEQLAKRGIKSSDLDYVVLSHLHSDHASGLKLVRDAKKIIVSEPEWVHANGRDKIRYVPSMWSGVNVETYAFRPSEYGPVNASFDLFDDGSIQLVHTPGHAEGLVSTLVTSEGKFVLLFADAGYAKKSWEQLIPPGTAVNRRQAMETLEWVRMMSLQESCIKSLASHDTETEPQIIEL